jgi:hypothetical protein
MVIPSRGDGQILIRHIRMAHLHQENLRPLHLFSALRAA